jgi:hypothetical protein
MDDEHLAEFLDSLVGHCSFCPVGGDCEIIGDESCADRICDWLGKEMRHETDI